MKSKLLSITLSLAIIFTMGIYTPAFGADNNTADNAAQTQIDLDGEVDTDPADEDDIDEGFEDGDEDAEAPVEEEDPQVEFAAPTSVKAKALGKSSIKITWSEVEGAEGYKVYCYSKSSKSYKRIASVEDTAYTHKGLAADTRKVYKVAAYAHLEDGTEVVGDKSKKASATTDDNDDVTKLMKTAKSKLGCAYRAGAQGPSSFDCSGFVYYAFKKSDVGKKTVIRSSAQGQYASLKKYSVGKNMSNAKVGDIIFFSASGSTSGINHVGIYAGGGKVVHAGSYRTGVCYGKISQLSRCGRKVCAIVRNV